MNTNFLAVLAGLGLNAAFEIANAARSGAEYLFATFLPEIARPDYNISSGNLTIRPTMAGLVGMDSAYPPGGAMTASTFLEQSAKIANQVPLNETTLRQIQAFVQQLQLSGGNTNEALAQTALNFLDKVIIQAHLDTAEWLRARCLVSGAIDWTFNSIHLEVDYGIPAANLLPARSGNDAWNGSTSKFWTDMTLLRQALRGTPRGFVVSPATFEAIVYNTANGGVIVAESGSGGIHSYEFQRKALNSDGTVIPGLFSPDARERLRFTVYSAEAEIINPNNPAQTAKVPFMPDGKLLAIGNASQRGFIVGQGSTDDPNLNNRLGYTHLAPTVEGNGAPGRWARLYTPENAPWSLNGQGVSNMLPVLEAPDQVAVATSTIV